MRNILEGYRRFAIDPKKSRSKDFYKNMLEYREHTLKLFGRAIKKEADFVCLLCNTKRKVEFLALGKYKLYECKNCSLVSPNINFALADEHELYDDPANSKDVVREIIETYDYRKLVHAPERLAYLMEKTGLKKKDITLLDVGCGPGYFLSHLSDNKIKNKGLELTDFLVEVCKKKGLNVAGTFLNQEKAAAYTALTLFDVLEHITDPVPFFKDSNRALKKGGYVLAYMPHIHSLAYELMGNRQNTFAPFQHVAFYDPKSLAYLAKKTGFKVHSIEYFGLDIMDYFCMKQYDDNFDYLGKLAELIPTMQAVVDKQNISNHMRVVFKKVSNV